MKKRILQQLKDIEQQYDIEVLFAVESGSRAWGFASPDSDFDIRFVYKRKTKSYLSLWESKDSIEFMTEDELDGSGWDLKKATLLLAKSNASILGWLFSPIIYIDKNGTLDAMKKLAIENFNPLAGFHHSHSMNKGFYEQLASDELKIKAFFYATRTAFCAHWILIKNTIPPVKFQDLYALINEDAAKSFDKLIEQKATIKEAGKASIDKKLITLVSEIVLKNNNLNNTLKPKKATIADFDLFFLNQLS